MPGNGRHPCGGGDLLALDLVAHGGDRVLIGADEDNAGLRQCAGKRLALGEKAIARMHRLGTRLLAGGDDLLDDEIALRGGRRAQQHRLIRHLDVQGVLVGFGIDRNCLDTETVRGPDDPTCDLAPIGDQNPLEHAANGPRRGLSLCGGDGQMSIGASAPISKFATIRGTPDANFGIRRGTSN